ncbi:MAG: response regulator transcription factor [Janthinobacterium lividum]
MIRVLVIEDDGETAAEIVEDFSAAGFTVALERDGNAGLARAQSGSFDVVTLDRMLPGLDGLALLDRLRATGVTTPVLVLSALSSVDERIRGLRAGGDDYLAKPFFAAELRARVEVLARRPAERDSTVLRFEDLQLDLLGRTARRGERVLDLYPREFKLLEFLVRHAGQVVTRAMLFEQVWGYSFHPGTNLVDVHIGKLRRKIDGAGDPMLIHTVRGTGFVLRMPEA